MGLETVPLQKAKHLFEKFLPVLSKVIKSSTSRNTLWIFGGNLFNRGIGLITFMLLTRYLGPSDYGVLSIAMAVLTMASDLSDLGINTSALRYGAEYASNGDNEKLSHLFGVVIRSRFVISLAVFLLGVLISAPLANLLYKDPSLTPYLMVAFLGVFTTLFQSAFSNFLLAIQHFRQFVLANVAYGLAALLGILFLFAAGKVSILAALSVYLVAPIVSMIVSFLLIPRQLMGFWRWDKEIAIKLFNFGKWMTVYAIFNIVQVQLNIFMLAAMMDSTQVGLYNAAFRIAVLAQIISNSYGTVLTPKIASIGKKPQLWDEFKKSLVISGAIAALIAFASLLAHWIIPLLTGEDFLESIPILQVLLLGMGVYTLGLPFHSTLYAMEKPYIFVITAAASFAVTISLNLLLIPEYKGIGPAWTYMGSQFISVAIAAFIAVLSLRKIKGVKRNL